MATLTLNRVKAGSWEIIMGYEEKIEIETHEGFYFSDISEAISAYAEFHGFTPDEIREDIELSSDDAENLKKMGYHIQEIPDTNNPGEVRYMASEY
jgi:hypothetical protein